MRISVHGSAELQALITRMRGLDRATASQLRKQTRAVVEPVWKQAVAENVSGRFESKVLGNTARASVTDKNVTLRAAAVGRALSGGGKPSELYAAAEFGANRDKVRQGRHTQRQFRRRNTKGYAVYPAAASVIPRIASLWVQTVVRSLHDAIEGR